MQRNRWIGLVAGALTVAATIGVGGSAVASDTRGTSSQEALAWSTSLGPWGNTVIGGYACPSKTPYLLNHRFHPKLERVVPKGVRVDEPGGVGVTIGLGYAVAGTDGYVTGWISNDVYTRASNWLLEERSVRVYANCTADPAQAYTLRQIND